jgi:hypothetical protein
MCPGWTLVRVARPEGFEPPTLCLEGRCSIRLSYGRPLPNFSYCKRLRYFQFSLNILPITYFVHGDFVEDGLADRLYRCNWM